MTTFLGWCRRLGPAPLGLLLLLAATLLFLHAPATIGEDRHAFRPANSWRPPAASWAEHLASLNRAGYFDGLSSSDPQFAQRMTRARLSYDQATRSALAPPTRSTYDWTVEDVSPSAPQSAYRRPQTSLPDVPADAAPLSAAFYEDRPTSANTRKTPTASSYAASSSDWPSTSDWGDDDDTPPSYVPYLPPTASECRWHLAEAKRDELSARDEARLSAKPYKVKFGHSLDDAGLESRSRELEEAIEREVARRTEQLRAEIEALHSGNAQEAEPVSFSCQWQFSHYEPSPWEVEWTEQIASIQERDRLRTDPPMWGEQVGSVCEKLVQSPDLDRGIYLVARVEEWTENIGQPKWNRINQTIGEPYAPPPTPPPPPPPPQVYYDDQGYRRYYTDDDAQRSIFDRPVSSYIPPKKPSMPAGSQSTKDKSAIPIVATETTSSTITPDRSQAEAGDSGSQSDVPASSKHAARVRRAIEEARAAAAKRAVAAAAAAAEAARIAAASPSIAAVDESDEMNESDGSEEEDQDASTDEADDDPQLDEDLTTDADAGEDPEAEEEGEEDASAEESSTEEPITEEAGTEESVVDVTGDESDADSEEGEEIDEGEQIDEDEEGEEEALSDAVDEEEEEEGGEEETTDELDDEMDAPASAPQSPRARRPTPASPAAPRRERAYSPTTRPTGRSPGGRSLLGKSSSSRHRIQVGTRAHMRDVADQLFSRMHYKLVCTPGGGAEDKRQHDDSFVVARGSDFIEPLTGLLRDPLSMCDFPPLSEVPYHMRAFVTGMGGNDLVQSKRWLVTQAVTPFEVRVRRTEEKSDESADGALPSWVTDEVLRKVNSAIDAVAIGGGAAPWMHHTAHIPIDAPSKPNTNYQFLTTPRRASYPTRLLVPDGEITDVDAILRMKIDSPAASNRLQQDRSEEEEQTALSLDSRGRVSIPASISVDSVFSNPLSRRGSAAAPRVLLFDLGASYFGGWGADTSALGSAWFYKQLALKGRRIDHVYAWEYELLDPVVEWNQIPADLYPHFTFINAGVTAETNATNNPWNTLLAVARPTDYVIVKLDIDSDWIETPLMEQLLATPQLQRLVDEMFFEHHVKLLEMDPYWKATTGSITLSYQWYTTLRKAGIRMHSWP